MTVDKSNPRLYVHGLLFGGVLPSQDMAENFASVILRGLHGEEELKKTATFAGD